MMFMMIYDACSFTLLLFDVQMLSILEIELTKDLGANKYLPNSFTEHLLSEVVWSFMHKAIYKSVASRL